MTLGVKLTGLKTALHEATLATCGTLPMAACSPGAGRRHGKGAVVVGGCRRGRSGLHPRMGQHKVVASGVHPRHPKWRRLPLLAVIGAALLPLPIRSHPVPPDRPGCIGA